LGQKKGEGAPTTKDIDELKKRIGSNKFDEIKAFVERRRAEGKSPDEIEAAVRAKFGKDIERDLPIVPVVR
jgi:hypothetical protein